jgi:hypothetical protein
MRTPLLLLAALAAAACSGAGPAGAATPSADPGATHRVDADTRAAPALPTEAPVVAADDAPPLSPPISNPRMVVTPTARVAGTGEIVVDLRSEGWPGRAQSPALVIGQDRHETGEHPEPTVLRFVLPVGAAFPPGAPCSVWYGDDEVARFAAPEVAR